MPVKTVSQIFIELTDRVDPIRREGTARIDGLLIAVKVLDARMVWNKPQVLISPISGSGEKWIDSTTLTLRQDTERERKQPYGLY